MHPDRIEGIKIVAIITLILFVLMAIKELLGL